MPRGLRGRLRSLHPLAGLALLATLALAAYITLRPPFLLAVPIALAMGVGTEGILRSHPSGGERWQVVAWIVPGLAAGGLALTISLFDLRGLAFALAAFGLAGLLLLTLMAEYAILHGGARWVHWGRVTLNLATYLTLFGLCLALLTSRMNPLFASLGVGIVAALLAMSMVHQAQGGLWRAGLYSVVIGLALSEIRWALTALPLTGPMTAVALLLAFYLFTGLVQNHLHGHLTRALGIEFGTVAGAGLLLLYGLNVWML